MFNHRIYQRISYKFIIYTIDIDMTSKQRIKDRVDVLVNEAHEFISNKRNNGSKASYQDLLNLYFFTKLAMADLHFEALAGINDTNLRIV